MITATIIENKHYEVNELKVIFSDAYDEIMQFCNVNKISNRSTNKISFSFVGCLFLKNGAILFLPKYFKDENKVIYSKQMKLLLKVLNKYQKNKIENPTDYEILDEEDDYLRLYGTVNYLIQQYIEHGLYLKEYSEKILHGHSEIDWQTTIDQETPYLSRTGSPVYFDLIKEELEYDWLAPITQIHKSVLNHCSKLIHEWGLYDILDWPHIGRAHV